MKNILVKQIQTPNGFYCYDANVNRKREIIRRISQTAQ